MSESKESSEDSIEIVQSDSEKTEQKTAISQLKTGVKGEVER